MSSISLSFGPKHSSTYKIAEFPTIELKNKYVEDEGKDVTCKHLYYARLGAKSIADAAEFEEQLGIARYAFYKKWIVNNMSAQMTNTGGNNPRLPNDDDPLLLA